MPAAKDCHTLTSYYVKIYKEKYGNEPNVNRYSARWGFDSLLMGLSVVEIKELLDYYLTTPQTRQHDLDWFFYNYEKLIRSLVETREDAEYRAKLMEESRIRAEKWRQSGKQGITSPKRSLEE